MLACTSPEVYHLCRQPPKRPGDEKLIVWPLIGVESWDLLIHPHLTISHDISRSSKVCTQPRRLAALTLSQWGAWRRSALARALQDINLISVCWCYFAFLFGILMFKLHVESFSCTGLCFFFASNQAHLFTLLQSTAPALIWQTRTGKQLFRRVLGVRYARMLL